MSFAWARYGAACVLAIFAASVPGPGGQPACAPDASAAEKAGAAGVGTAQASRKPSKASPIKSAVPSPPPRPGLAHPAGWPAAPIGDGSTNHRGAPLTASPPEQPKSQELQNIVSPSPEAPPETEEQNFFQRMIRARTRAIESEPGDPRRKELAEPPDGYRRQTPSKPDAPEAVDDETTKSPGIFGTIGAIWGNLIPPGKTDGAAAGAASGPKPGSDAGETGGLLGKIGGMMPGFLRGSDKK